MTELDPNLIHRVQGLDWTRINHDLHAHGSALTTRLLANDECDALVNGYDTAALYRSTIDMYRYRFGSGQYRYFTYPLPELLHELRAAFWPMLLPVAREWWNQLGRECPWPNEFADWLEICRSSGQTKATPLILKYGPGDWNALHRDLYGECVFPMQVVIGLNEPNVDYTGGEFVTVEQRPRAQSRARTTVIPKGHAVIFTTRDRPIRSARGYTTSPMRHGISDVQSGLRHAVGLLFHDAT
jgi:uncharacterized protein